MSWKDNCDSLCPIARALTVVGDRWTLLILRELSFGVHRFEEIQAQTEMSSHSLASRLKQMEEAEIVARRLYSTRPDRYEYFATDKGKDLDAVLLALRAWNLKWDHRSSKEEFAVKLVHKKSGELIDGNWQNPPGESFSFDHTDARMSDSYRAEREGKRKKFSAGKRRR
jgi:DNA-binding HxlR family transcriptional regulator